QWRNRCVSFRMHALHGDLDYERRADRARPVQRRLAAEQVGCTLIGQAIWHSDTSRSLRLARQVKRELILPSREAEEPPAPTDRASVAVLLIREVVERPPGR